MSPEGKGEPQGTSMIVGRSRESQADTECSSASSTGSHLSSSAGSQGPVPDSEERGELSHHKRRLSTEQKHMETGEPTSVLFDVWRLDSSHFHSDHKSPLGENQSPQIYG